MVMAIEKGMATMLTRALIKSEVKTEFDLVEASRFVDDGVLSDWGRHSVYFMV